MHLPYSLGDLWESLEELSIYGVGVPFVLKGEHLVQYYVPSLSAIQLYVNPTKNPLSLRSASENGLRSGELVFEDMENAQPYDRMPLTDKVSTLAVNFPRLMNYRSNDLLPSSWMSIAWYPIYRIPMGPTRKDLEAVFLTFHYLSTNAKGSGDIIMNPTMAMGKGSIFFPDGLQVLLVDTDLGSLQELAKMCLSCGYEVTTAIGASEALSILRNNRIKFDIVISDISISDMDVFPFIEIISIEMDLPLVLMSANSDENTVVKGYNCGACDYLSKPVQMENIKFIWKHVVHKQKQKAKYQSQKEANVENLRKQSSFSSNTVNEKDKERTIIGSSKSDGVEIDEIPQKKNRIVWIQELHEEFVKIVDKLGVKDAVPKRILEMMKGRGLTRENVASHLQKYRLYLKKLEQTSEEKAYKHSQASDFCFSSQQYSGQNQVNLGQKGSNTYFMGCTSAISPFSIENYGVARSRYGMQLMGNVAEQERLSPSISMYSDHLSPSDQFSRFEIGNNSCLGNLTSSPMESPYKVRKLGHDVADLSNVVWLSATTFPSTRNDVSPRFPFQFRENEFSVHNESYMSYSDVPQSSPELISPTQHFNVEDTTSYPQQHVEWFNGHHMD